MHNHVNVRICVQVQSDCVRQVSRLFRPLLKTYIRTQETYDVVGDDGHLRSSRMMTS